MDKKTIIELVSRILDRIRRRIESSAVRLLKKISKEKKFKLEILSFKVMKEIQKDLHWSVASGNDAGSYELRMVNAEIKSRKDWAQKNRDICNPDLLD